MILTRKNYCKATLEKMLNIDLYKRVISGDLDQYGINKAVMSSTTVGICLQELGIINHDNFPDLDDYLNDRVGIYMTYVDYDSFHEEDDEADVQVMSFRELLSLLPEE